MNSKDITFTSSIDKVNIMYQELEDGQKLITMVNKSLIDGQSIVTQIKPEDFKHFQEWVASL